MAARVATELKQESGLNIQTKRGGLGEFSVLIDHRRVIDTNRLWYPSPKKVIKEIRKRLEE
jgi:hypothetical protein